jgi:hypothetical protein
MMPRMRSFALALLLTVFLASCGGSSSDGRLLHLTGQNETEGNFRDRLEDYKRDDPAGFTALCEQAKGGDAEQVVEALTSGSRTGHVFPGTTPQPEQTAVPEDRQRAAEILRDEC